MFGFLKKKKSEEELYLEDLNQRRQVRDGGAGFELKVEDVFAVSGRGTVVTGRVSRGTVSQGDRVLIRGREGRVLEVNASSLGGGRVRVNAIDGMEATFTGDYPTLIIRNEDKPGQVAEVAGLLSEHGVNIAAMQLYRDRRGGLAVMVIESDQPIPEGMADYLRTLPGIVRCTYLNMGEAD